MNTVAKVMTELDTIAFLAERETGSAAGGEYTRAWRCWCRAVPLHGANRRGVTLRCNGGAKRPRRTLPLTILPKRV